MFWVYLKHAVLLLILSFCTGLAMALAGYGLDYLTNNIAELDSYWSDFKVTFAFFFLFGGAGLVYSLARTIRQWTKEHYYNKQHAESLSFSSKKIGEHNKKDES